jgi:hypothetical protein
VLVEVFPIGAECAVPVMNVYKSSNRYYL